MGGLSSGQPADSGSVARRPGPPRDDTNLAGQDPNTLYTQVQTADPGQVGQIADSWNNIGSALETVNQVLSTGAAAGAEGWTGAAADNALRFHTQVAQWTAVATQASYEASGSVFTQSDAASTAKYTMPKPINYGLPQALTDFAADPFSAGAIQERLDQAQQNHAEITRVAQDYDSSLNQTSQQMPALGPTPSFTGAGTEGASVGGTVVSGRIAVPGGRSVSGGSSGGGAGGGGRSGRGGSVSGGSGAGEQVDPVPPVGSEVPGSAGAGAPVPAGPVSSGQHTVLSGTTGSPGGGSSGDAPADGGGNSDGGLSGELGTVLPVGPPGSSGGFGDGGSGFGPVGSGIGGSGFGGSAIGSGRAGGVGAGRLPGGRSAVGGSTNDGRTAAGAMSAAEDATADGTASPGVIGTGRGRRGDADTEHRRPAYLVEPDVDSIFGTDEMTAPPVIGG